MLLSSAHCPTSTKGFLKFLQSKYVFRPNRGDFIFLPEDYQAQVALRQLEDCGVPCECPLCATAYLRLQRIQHEKEERELRRPSRDYVQYD